MSSTRTYTEWHKGLKAGDRVRLIKPFRYEDDDQQDDEEYDTDLRACTPHGDDVLGTVTRAGWEDDRLELLIHYDIAENTSCVNQLWTDPEALGPELDPPTDDEVQAAINSILGGTP